MKNKTKKNFFEKKRKILNFLFSSSKNCIEFNLASSYPVSYGKTIEIEIIVTLIVINNDCYF